MLASLHIYPLKGGRAVDLDQAAVEPWGLAGDRRWLLVDADAQFMSQRKHPALARVVVRPGPGAGITVSSDGYPALPVAAPDESAELLKVTVWRSTVLAAAAGDEADAWFSGYLGEPVRLVYLDDPTRRAVDPEYGRGRRHRQLRRRLPAAADQHRLARPAQPVADRGRRPAGADEPVPAERRGDRLRAVGRGPSGGGSGSARSRSASPSRAAGAWSPPPTRPPANAARSRCECSRPAAGSAKTSYSGRTSSPTPPALFGSATQWRSFYFAVT